MGFVPLTRVISQRSGEISSIENRRYLQEISRSCLTRNDERFAHFYPARSISQNSNDLIIYLVWF